MKRFDLLIPCGSACLTSASLRENRLQLESYPLDWVTPVTLEDAVNFFKNKFNSFFDFTDLVIRGKPDNGEHLVCFNKKTHTLFLHDFPLDIPIEDSFQEQKDKYDRRILRLYRRIGQSKRILFLHIYNGEEKFDHTYIEKQFSQLSKLLPQKDLSLLFVTLSKEQNSQKYTCEKISPSIKVCTCFSDGTINKPGEYWNEYRKNLQEILSEYKLNKKLKSRIRRERSSWKDSVIFIIKKIKRFPLNLISCLIPSKRLRHKLKGKKFLKIKKDVDLN